MRKNIHFLIIGALILNSFVNVFCPPPPPKRQQTEPEDLNHKQDENKIGEEDPQKLYVFPYSKYLELVVKILESQPKFQEHLRGMDEQDIKAGKIADHLDDLPEDVFDKLTKAKIEEIERIRGEIEKQIAKEGDARNIVMPEHLDVDDWQKFGKEDLRKLIQKTVADMNKIDEERKQKFKEYEMKKKAEEDHKLAQMNPEEREKQKKEIDEAQKRHEQHEQLKHPGGKEQLEEVWEESDHMDKDSFDPRTFFGLHDLNGDGFWNDEEIEALFQIELEKVYNDTNPDDDPRERIEEMYRMREHVVKQMDKNGDRLISLQEFLQDAEAQAPESAKDEGWKDLGDQKIYTEEELALYEKEYAAKQGWGEHAYVPVTAIPPPPPPSNMSQQQQPIMEQQKPQAVPVAHPPPPPNAVVPPQPVSAHNQQAAQAPPEKPMKIDPVYGIPV